MICSNCQADNIEGTRFCRNCGNPLALAERDMPVSFGLAGRGSRLGAALIDGLVVGVPYIVLALITPTLGLVALGAIFIFQMFLLTKDGQTLGKKALSMRIVKVNTGRNGGFIPNVLLRVVVNGLLGIVPFYGLVSTIYKQR